MKITNRSGRTLTIQVPTGYSSPPFYQTWIEPNRSWEENVGRDSTTVSVEPGKISGTGAGGGFTFPWNPMVKDAGPYPNTHALLLVDGGRTIVDWSGGSPPGGVRAKYLSGIKTITASPDEPNPELERGLAVASAVISACATGLAALGPVGAAPATIVQTLASMIALATPEQTPPAPPDIDQIEAVVEKVVAEQSEKDFALLATDSFLLAQQWLVDQDAALRSAAKTPAGGVKGERHDLVNDFYQHLENWANENGDFRRQVHLMCRRPEIAKWIIPAFLAGVGAYLQILRLHAVANHKTDRETIRQFQREVDTCSKALIAAAEAWWGYILKRLQDDSIYGTPEGDWVYYTLNRAYVGADTAGPLSGSAARTAADKTPIGSAVFHLSQVSEYLDEDLNAIDNGKPPTHFYKPAWEATAPTTT